MTKLSVNINKIATLRNSRGGDVPNVVKVALDAERFGAEGITVHPRPDERHIRRSDVYELKEAVTTEFNIEGYPSDDFIAMVCDVRPEQVTLVPDPPEALTSSAGWDTIKHKDFLIAVVKKFKDCGIRVSIFVEANDDMVRGAKETLTDRIELYTESYARLYEEAEGDTAKIEEAIAPFVSAAKVAVECGLGINAGHDLSKENLKYFAQNIPSLSEVSIGHALIADALYLGLENTIGIYRRCLEK